MDFPYLACLFYYYRTRPTIINCLFPCILIIKIISKSYFNSNTICFKFILFLLQWNSTPVFVSKSIGLYTYLKIVHHFRKSQPGGGHRDTAVATTLYATVIIGVRLIARITDHIHFVCNRKYQILLYYVL